MTLTLSSLAAASGGIAHAPDSTSVSGIAIDSRKVKQGDLFVAIPGTQADGHNYVRQAVLAGATCLLVSRPVDSDLPYILVDDTVAALGRIAHAYRKTLSPLTVGVTGSVGKTTTKQLIASVLSTVYRTHRTSGNFNNELGLPLTLLALTKEHQAAVLEMGMSQIGEIEYLSRLAMPDIGVITCIGTSHMEALGSRERIRDAKMEILLGMSATAPLVLDGDEPLLRVGYENAIYVGFEPTGDKYRRISNLRSDSGRLFFDLTDESGRTVSDLSVPGAGAHLAKDAAMAYTVGQIASLPEDAIRKGLRSFENTGMRQKVTRHSGITFITDCYNAAPESMTAALRVLHELGTDGKRIAVLGDMLELGRFSDSLHEKIGRTVFEEDCDLLFTFGPLASAIASGARSAGMKAEGIYSFPDISAPDALAEALKNAAKPGDTLLFKASRGIAMERVIDAFQALIEE